MVKYVGIRNDTVVAVSDRPFDSSGMNIVESKLDDPMSSSLRTSPVRKSLSGIRLALVGNWRMACGISTYSEKLWPEVARGVGNVRLFVEKNDSPTGPMNVLGSSHLRDEDVVQCWKRGETTGDLADAIDAYDPDIVWIQHEWGLWPNARHWLSLMGRLSGRRIVTTMHSIFRHRDKLVCEAAIPEMIVHLDGARNVLINEKKVRGRVHVVPHGCDPCLNRTKLWNLYRSPRTFMQVGFGFRYKGWETSLDVARILSERYDDVFFTGIFSESPFSRVEHDIYHEELMSIVSKNGLSGNVSIVRGFQSDEVIDSYVRTNQAVVFPYVTHPQHEVYGASGAARMVMSKAVPVVTTSVNHFSDIPTLKGDDAKTIAGILDRLFSDPIAKKKQVDRQLQYVEENGWDNVAKRHLKLFEGRAEE